MLAEDYKDTHKLYLARELLVHGHHSPALYNTRPADAGDVSELLPVPPNVMDIPAQHACLGAAVTHNVRQSHLPRETAACGRVIIL